MRIATEKNGLSGRWVNLLEMIDLYVRKSLPKLSYRLERSMWCPFNGTPFLCVRRVSHFADTSITCPIFGTVPFIGQGVGLFSLALGESALTFHYTIFFVHCQVANCTNIYSKICATFWAKFFQLLIDFWSLVWYYIYVRLRKGKHIGLWKQFQKTAWQSLESMI